MYYRSTGEKIAIVIGIIFIVISIVTVILYVQGFFNEPPVEVSSAVDISEELSEPELSKDRFSYECLINGKSVKLPCTVADLERCGYKLDEKDANSILSPKYNTFADMTMGDDKITLHFVNAFAEDRLYKDCYVYGITVRESDTVSQTFEICGGLGIGSDLTEVKSVYGEVPSWEGKYAYDEDQSIFIVYSTSNNFEDGLDDEIEFTITDDKVEIIYFYVGQPKYE